MNLLGKVFTLLVLLLSVIFFSLALAVNSTHINWHDKADEFEKQAAEAKRKNTELDLLLEESKTKIAIEQAGRRSALAALQTQLEKNESELQAQEAELQQKNSENTIMNQTLNATQLELSSRTKDNELLRQQLADAKQDRDQLFQRLVAAKDETAQLMGMYDALMEREKANMEMYTKAKAKLDILGINPDTMLEAPPAVNGQVLAVAGNQVEVSLGRDDGMREGFTLEVHRNGQYLGRLKVRTVRDDKSVADILTNFQKGYIRRGDRVDSKLF